MSERIPRVTDAYQTYIRYKTVIELLKESPMTTEQIIERSKLSQATVYSMIKILLRNNVIVIDQYIGQKKVRMLRLK